MSVSLFIKAALILSFFAFLFSGIRLFYRCLIKKASFQTELLFFASGVLISLVSVIFVVNTVTTGLKEFSLFSVDNGREFLHAIVQSLKVFGVEENFVDLYLSPFRAIVKEYIFFEHYYGFINFYVAILCSVAPVTTGIFLFEVLTSIFPKIRLFFASLFRKTFYFNELNEFSLTFAKSIKESKKLALMPVIVFCDVYDDKNKEKISELKLLAKDMNAICLSDDISHVKMTGFKNKNVVLIDENEHDNLQNLVNLLNGKNAKALQNADIYLFINSDAYVPIEKSIKALYNKKYGLPNDSKPFNIFPIRAKKNLVYNLLDDVPLFEPLVGIDVTNPYDLNLTILGCGEIGLEMFLAAYWCCQMKNCRLNINILSDEDESDFVNRINQISPEILKSGKPFNDVLRYNQKNDSFNEPYFTYKYHKIDATKDILNNALLKDSAVSEEKIIDSDYFVVSLGSDERNISVAQTIKNCVSRYQVDKLAEGKANIKNKVISYVVFDSKICDALNAESKASNNVYLYAFGSKEQVYSVDNIILRNASMVTGNDLSKKKSGSEFRELIEKSIKVRSNDEYGYWSNNAKMLHYKYQLFSNGLIRSSIFKYGNDLVKSNEIRFVTNKLLKKYGFLESAEVEKADINKEIPKDFDFATLWCEHRRWNAYIRSEGFICPDSFEVYYNSSKTHKNLPLKLHPCLVESKFGDLKENIFDDKYISYLKKIDENNVDLLLPYDNETDVDYLDQFSLRLNRLNNKQSDYKSYDSIKESLEKFIQN